MAGRAGGRGPVAIVGMAVLLPGAPDLDTYWRNLRDGVDAITDIPDGRRDPSFHDLAGAEAGPPSPDRTYCHRGGFVDPAVTIEPRAFGVMPASVAGMEPDQLFALRVASAAVNDAGGRRVLGDPGRTGVVLGRGGYLSPGLARFDQRVRTVRQVLHTLTELMPGLSAGQLAAVRAGLLEPLGELSPESTIGLVPNLAASRVAGRLDLGGPAYTVDAACASSLIAVDHAISELHSGRCDAMLAGGVHHCHDDTLWSMFTQLGALSPTQSIRPLARDADGLLIGEGTGVVLLKRLADARRDGDRVYAVLRGAGVSSDGQGASPVAPDSRGQEVAVRRAWAEAGLDPAAADSIGLLEAHSTGTKVGDEAELATLARVFGGAVARPAVIGSVKSMIGHTLPAAGVAGLIKAALAIHHATLLPTLHCADPNPALAGTRFRPIPAARPWDLPGPRRAAVNAFGFGGINAHVLLEAEEGSVATARSVGRGPARVGEPERTLRLAGADPAALARLLDGPDAAVLRRCGAEPVAPVGETGSRIGIVDPTERRLAVARRVLAKAAQGCTSWHGAGDVWFSARPLLRAEPTARLALLFPGLEAEFAPRCADLAEHYGLREPAVSGDGVLAKARTVLDTGLLLHRVLRRIGLEADGFAGHSVGEWTAMVAAGMYAEENDRGLLDRFGPDMGLPEVDFLVLGCSAEAAERLIAATPGMELSHDNGPRQSIVCGPESTVDTVARAARAAGVVARILPFRSGFHTSALRPFLPGFRRLITESLLAPAAPRIWSATTARPYPDDATAVRELFLRHLVAPVRFRQLVDAMYEAGFRVFVQAGPGQLGSFVADTLGERPHLVVSANSAQRPGLDQLRRLRTALWVEGVELTTQAGKGGPSAGAEQGQGVSLRTSTPLLSVSPETRGLIDGAPRRELPPGVAAEVVAEFDALLAETRDAARSVCLAAQHGAAGVEESTVDLDISVDAMPYLRDHRFFQQPEDWADEADRRPVVPATTLVELAIDRVRTVWPDEVAIAVHGARFDRWLVAEPALRVPLRISRTGGLVSVNIGEFASLTVELATGYPAPPAPQAGPEQAEPEWVPPLPAAEIYRRREMFHGPAFQGLHELHGIGAAHIRGSLTVPPAPGALLDNAGQLLGCWLMATETERLLAFPRSIREITLHGPQPPQGTRLDCVVRVSTPDPAELVMDAELRLAGRVWARIRGWCDVRLACDRQAHRVYAFPRDNRLAEQRRDGLALVRDRWPTVAARDIFAGVYLAGAERAEFARRPLRQQRDWLLARIAAKDAAREWLSANGTRALFPAELVVTEEDGERLRVRPARDRTLPELRVAVACSGGAAMAVARPLSAPPLRITVPADGGEPILSRVSRQTQ